MAALLTAWLSSLLFLHPHPGDLPSRGRGSSRFWRPTSAGGTTAFTFGGRHVGMRSRQPKRLAASSRTEARRKREVFEVGQPEFRAGRTAGEQTLPKLVHKAFTCEHIRR